MKRSAFVLLTGILAGLLCSSCVTSDGYTKFYDEWKNTATLTDFIPLGATETPVIRTSSNIDSDYWDVISDNYVCLGYSGFTGLDFGTANLMEQAKKVGATLVLYQKAYEKTVNLGTTTTYNPTINTATTNTTTIDRYSQDAYYFVKSTKKWLFGIFGDDLTSELREKVKRNTGVYVLTVIKQTPAFNANLMRGDVIIKLNDVNIATFEQLKAEENKYKAGDTITFVVWKDGKEVPIKFTL